MTSDIEFYRTTIMVCALTFLTSTGKGHQQKKNNMLKRPNIQTYREDIKIVLEGKREREKQEGNSLLVLLLLFGSSEYICVNRCASTLEYIIYTHFMIYKYMCVCMYECDRVYGLFYLWSNQMTKTQTQTDLV